MPQIPEHGDIETVVRTHAEWVHACANRRVGNEAMAEDVTQAVFILFWRRRRRLGKELKVTGWLYRAVRYCAADALRDKRIRERHEREAAMAGLRDRGSGAATWNEVSPELEQAVDRLGEADRAAVLLRFYRQMSFAQVGQSLGIGEEAARKRVERAVGKLREKLSGTGVEVEAGSLGAMVLAHAAGGGGGMEGGAAGLVEKVMAGIGDGGGNGTAGLIAKGAEKMMVMAKVKVAAVVVLMVAAAVGVVIAAQSSTGPVSAAPMTAAPWAALPASRAAEDPHQLLQKVSQAVAWTKQSFSEKVQLELRASLGSTKVGTDSTVERYQCSDGRLHIVYRPTQALDRGKWVKSDFSLDFLLAADEKYYLWSEAPSDPAYAYVQIMRSKENMERWRGFRNGGLRHAHFLEDFYETSNTSGSILDLAKSGTVDPAVWTEQIGGVECYRLDAQTKLGHLRMWISPTQGSNVVRYTLEQKADSAGNTPLSVVFEATKVIKVNGQYVISEGSYEVKDVYEGNNNVQSAKAKRTEITFNPVFDANVFTTHAVRDGWKARFDDDLNPGIDYVWRNGNAVPKDDRQTVDEWHEMQTLFVMITMYAKDHKGAWPDKLDDLAKLLGPSLPRTITGYVYVKPAVPINPQSLILYEAFDAWPTEGVGVGFADGHCERISDEAAFRKLLKAAEGKP